MYVAVSHFKKLIFIYERCGDLQSQRMQTPVPSSLLHGAELLVCDAVAAIAELALLSEVGHVFEALFNAARLSIQSDC